MRVSPPLIAVASAVLLAGCSAVLGPKPIPEWAMHSRPKASSDGQFARQSGWKSHQLASRVDRKDRQVSTSQPIITKSVRGPNGNTAPKDDLKLFTKEWYAREEAMDAQLRARIRICGAC